MNNISESIEYCRWEERIWRSKNRDNLFPQKIELFQSWMREYPKVFRLEYWNFMQNQPEKHFHECVVAKYFGDRGYGVLIEKYFCTSALEKYAIFKKHAGKILSLYYNPKTKAQPPDLFVYGKGNHFFVEVKGQSVNGWQDKLKPNQNNFFDEIRKRGIDVRHIGTKPGRVNIPKS